MGTRKFMRKKQCVYPVYLIVLCLTVVLALFCFAGCTPEKDHDRRIFDPAYDTAEGFAYGSGDGKSAETPFIIATSKHLDNIRNLYDGASELLYNFVLGADIDLKAALDKGGELCRDGKGWLPIGNDEYYFCGDFDGRGFTVRNLWIGRPEESYAGLFGLVYDSTIKNLNIVLSPLGITGGRFAGGLAGLTDSFGTEQQCLIENCSVTGKLKSCYDDVLSYGGLGGLAGAIYGTDVKTSYFSGGLTGSAYGGTGGISGFAWSANIEDCYARAEIITAGEAGGIIGATNRPGTKAAIFINISRCYTVLTGGNKPDTDFFVGFNDTVNKEFCVVKVSYGNGFGRFNESEKYTSVGAKALDETESNVKTSYEGLDFSGGGAWSIFEGDGTPYLKSFDNALLILPGKTYDGTPAFVPDFNFEGRYDKSKPVTLYSPAKELPDRRADFYDVEISYFTEYAYQIFIAPLYQIRKTELTVWVENVTKYGKHNPAFRYMYATGFEGEDDEQSIDGLNIALDRVSYNFDIENLRRGIHAINADTGLYASDYTFTYMIVVTGLYIYEIILIAAAGAAFLALSIFTVVWFVVKKKTVKDLGRAVKGVFIREKTVLQTIEVVKEVPLSARPLPMDEFTNREKEVAELLLLGKTRREIAEALFISEHTVKSHTENVFGKSDVKTQKAFIGKYLLGADDKNDVENADDDI